MSNSIMHSKSPNTELYLTSCVPHVYQVCKVPLDVAHDKTEKCRWFANEASSFACEFK